MTKIIIKPYQDFYEAQVFELILKIQNEEFAMNTAVSDHQDLEKIASTYQEGAYSNFKMVIL